MFNPVDDDDDLFVPQNSSSNLAGLFETASVTKPGNADLMYIPPKQPKRTLQLQSSTQPKSKPQNSVLFAKVVTVYKSQSDFNLRKVVGTYGLALIGDSDISKELILYIDNQNILARVIFASNNEVCIENGYVNLQDSNNKKWLIQFKDESSLNEFLAELKKVNVKITSENVSLKHIDDIDKTDNDNTRKIDKMSEQSSVSQTKADILLRMAKMGQPILPNNIKNKKVDTDDMVSPTPTINSKKDTDSNLNDVLSTKSQLQNENLTNNNNNEIGSLSTTPFASNSPSQLTPYISVYSAHHPSSNLINATLPSPEFNLFISENRIQNSEMRINLNSISSKLDNVLNEISKIREPNTDKLENEFLKSKISDLEKNISNLNKQLNEANNPTKYVELETLLKKKDQQVKDTEETIIALENSIKDAQHLQTKITNLEAKEIELNEKICTLEQKLYNSEMDLQKSNKTNSVLQETNTTLLQNNKDLNQKIALLESKNNSFHEDLNQKVNNLSNTIKDSMNLMYQNIVGQFEEPLLQNQMKPILSTNIKRATLDVIEKFHKCLLSPSNSSESVNDSDNSVK